LSQVGRCVILPSSFVSSGHFMYQLYQDSMAIVCWAGYPDIFLMLTANPKWCEIVKNLLPGQTAQDQPDLVAQVFHLKPNEVLELIYKGNIFGKAVVQVYTIEYQKHSLLHMHLLVFLD
ncbi:hypothetical protein DACRYDRAFT_38770, partial [Dacryopinax primogenitus]